MKAIINTTLLSQIKPTTSEYDIWDTKLTGFILRINPNGNMVYRCEYARGKRVTIGNAKILTPIQARDRAKEILADVVKGIDPLAAKKETKDITLQSFIENDYAPWVKAHRKSGDKTLSRLRHCFFKPFGDKQIKDLTVLDLEKWRTQKLNQGRKPVSVNRDLIALKAALSQAVAWNISDIHPLVKLKQLKADNSVKIRFLDKDEEQRLRSILDKREEKIRTGRKRANEWRKERNYELLPDLDGQVFADYIKPMVILSMNTGLRRGELFNLTWKDIDLKRAVLTVIAESAKSGKTRHVPLNSEALNILNLWSGQSKDSSLVFANPDGQRFNNVTKAWANILKAAQIENFRWHDMRHHFASKLVMAGVDLNTVRELLGHSDIKMTLRYAHLAPEHKAMAVEKLVTI